TRPRSGALSRGSRRPGAITVQRAPNYSWCALLEASMPCQRDQARTSAFRQLRRGADLSKLRIGPMTRTASLILRMSATRLAPCVRRDGGGNSGATGAGPVVAKFYCPLSKFAAFFKFHDCSTACRRTSLRKTSSCEKLRIEQSKPKAEWHLAALASYPSRAFSRSSSAFSRASKSFFQLTNLARGAPARTP